MNVKEEAGDILWYLAILFDEVDTTFSDEMFRVIRKLRIRFPDKFVEFDALNRRLDEERGSLEDES